MAVDVLFNRVFRFCPQGVLLSTFKGRTKRLGNTLHMVLYTWKNGKVITQNRKEERKEKDFEIVPHLEHSQTFSSSESGSC